MNDDCHCPHIPSPRRHRHALLTSQGFPRPAPAWLADRRISIVLNSYGWSETLQQQFQTYAARGLAPARVIVQQRGLYGLATPMGEVAAQLSGRFAHDAEAGGLSGRRRLGGRRHSRCGGERHHPSSAAAPQRLRAQGRGRRRRSAGCRRECRRGPPGRLARMRDLNARRIERYLATAWESGASPVVVLTKADLCTDRDARKAEIEAVALGVPVHVVSAVTGEGLEGLSETLRAGADGGVARQLRRRQVEPRQCAGRCPADGDAGDPRGGRARAPHHHPSPARAAAERAPGAGYARHARAGSVGCRCRRRRHLCRYRGAGGPVPLPRLRP